MRFTTRLLVPAIAAGLISGCSSDSATSTTTDASVTQQGGKAPDFALQTLSGETVRLSSRLGKPVLLNFWATWCGPCVVEMPDIQRLQETHGKDLQILGIDLKESLPQVEGFVKRNSLTWTFLLDANGDVGNTYGVTAIPTSVFIDARGIITARVVGTQSYAAFARLAEEAMAK